MFVCVCPTLLVNHVDVNGTRLHDDANSGEFSLAAFFEALIGFVALERSRVGMLVSSGGVSFPVGAAKTGKPLSAARVESAVTCLRTQVASVHMGVRVVAVSVLQLLLATAPAAGEWLRGTLCARCAPATCCRPA